MPLTLKFKVDLKSLGYEWDKPNVDRKRILQLAVNMWGDDAVAGHMTDMIAALFNDRLGMPKAQCPPTASRQSRLRDFGYSLKISAEARQDALMSAVDVLGYEVVDARLNELAQVWRNQARSSHIILAKKYYETIMDDIAFMNAMFSESL